MCHLFPFEVMTTLLTQALWLRFSLIIIGAIFDAMGGSLRFTDIDYDVFSDAALLVVEQKNPFSRLTYRYSPILALLLTPNYFFPSFGKILFCVADAYCVQLIFRILESTISKRIYCANKSQASILADTVYYSSLWALNPIVAIICSRGSSDSISNCLVLLCLQTILLKQVSISGLLFGLLIHFRLYPIVYAPAFLCHILLQNTESDSLSTNIRNACRFCVSSCLSCFSFTFISWLCYGRSYIDNALVYHIVRSDYRHNFSPHFYPTYLSSDMSNLRNCIEFQSECTSAVNELTTSSLLSKGLFFLPQTLIIFAIALFYARDNLPVCLLLQAMVFVTFNKVVTAQYFTWYACFIPICLPALRGMATWLQSLVATAWLTSLLNWLYWAYLLEFEGENTFEAIWMSSLLFFIVNVGVIVLIILHVDS